jgi:hypothetical protein
MKILIRLACLVVLGAVTVTASAGFPIPVDFGEDLGNPPPRIVFGGASDVPEIPAGFFGPGSEPFGGEIDIPLFPPGPLIPVAKMVFPGSPDMGAMPPMVPFELESLLLRSSAPLPVSFNGMPPDSFFDVYVELIPVPLPGELTLSYDSPDGGFIVDSFFDVTYEIEFTPEGQPRTGDLVITGALSGVLVDPLGGNAPWFAGFPNGARPGLVPGATEFDLQPIMFDLGNGSMQIPVIAVPEPMTMSLLGLGAVALLRRRRK